LLNIRRAPPPEPLLSPPGLPEGDARCPGFALEATSLSDEGPAEGEGCGSCMPTPATPSLLPSDVGPIVEVPCFHTVMLHQEDGEDICLTTTEGGMEMTGQEYMEDMDRKDNMVPFQMFPDPIEVVLDPECSANCLVHVHDNAKERLPSIVVEHTDVSEEVESGELRWPPENVDLEDEDLFLEQCIPPANIADWGEDEEDLGGEEETSVILNHQPSLTLIDLQSDAFRDDTPTLPPSNAPSLN